MKNYSSMFMDIAERTAAESNCIKYRVGSVVVKDNRVILQGYNGTISGFTNCCDKFSGENISNNPSIINTHYDWSIAFEVHSEMNIICYAAKKGIALEDTILYCTHSPCNNCLKHLIQAGIKEVVFKHDYVANVNFDERLELMKFISINHQP